MARPLLEIESREQDGSLVVRPNGVIDASNMEQFQSVMEEACRNDTPLVVLDCRELQYMNSSSYGLLFHFHRQCDSRNGRFCLCHVPHKVENVIRILGLHGILNIHASLEEALTAQAQAT